MDYLVEELNYKGYKIKIYIDDLTEDPRNWDNLGIMLCFHRRYNLGDNLGISFSQFSSWEEVRQYIRKELEGILLMPLYLLDHSSLWIKTSPFMEDPQGWDTSFVGYIFTTKEKIRKNFGIKRITKKIIERVKEILENEVKVYSYYLSGQSYFFSIENEKRENIESVGGFLGDFEESGLLEEAKSIIDYDIKRRQNLKVIKLKNLIKNKVELEKREKLLTV